MELSLEAYRNIVKNVGNRADIATLCRVSKGFQYVSERALYNTLYMQNAQDTISLCDTLVNQPRLAAIVDALTIHSSETEQGSEDDDEEEEAEPLPAQVYWSAIASALEHTTRLKYLNIHITNNFDSSAAWILNNCTFRLRSFHCDLTWDHNLVAFLNKQVDLDDLYIIDYNETSQPTDTTTMTTVAQPPSFLLDNGSLPNLATLECTFSEAAIAIVPGRPITHLKTCFSRSKLDEKRAEMSLLFSKIKLSTRPLRSLDIADSSYTEAFSMELLSTIVNASSTNTELRYVGTLVLPIGGRERLQFYGLLMRLPRVQCLELEVSDWVPPPSTPPAFRALASEMRLYNPTIVRAVYVCEFERTVVAAVSGVCRIDSETNTDFIWREI